MKLFQKVTDFKSDFTTFPKTFENYRWYTPILVLFIALTLFSVFGRFLFAIGNEIYTIVDFLIIIMAIPAIYIGTLIVRDRPFSSYLTSVGGWDWELFAKSAVIFLAFNLIYEIVETMIFGGKFDIKITGMMFFLVIVLTPFQSFAEELAFRGYAMQTLGSWFNFPIIALVIQAILFASIHGYNIGGFISIFIGGLLFGFLTWYSKGLETSTALHTIHNIFSFVLGGLGVASTITPSLEIILGVQTSIVTILAVAVIIIIDKKSDWINLKR